MAGVVIADGSGLSNDDRATCRCCSACWPGTAPTDAFGAGLPVAGVSGTLARHLHRLAARGRLQAKTGTLGNAPYNADPPAVKSLSGYVPVEGGGAIEFSLVLNAPDAHRPERVPPDLGPLRRRCWRRTRRARPPPSSHPR